MSQLVPILGGKSYENDYQFASMYTDSTTTTHARTKSLMLDGLNCGIPTRTTPTLTPTTLRNIEQTFIELQGHTGAAAGLAGLGLGLPVAGLLGSVDSEESGHQAGFMPPVIQPPLNTQGSSSIFMNLVDTKSWQGGTASVVTIDAAANSSSCSSTSSNPEMLRNITSSSVNTPTPPATPSSTRKNVGGRRPNRDNSISPEEEEKRKQRRERNKQAAARCRKRRLDHTNELLEETEGLESKKMILQSEIQQLQQEKDELEFLLETHKAVCRRLNGGGPPSPVDVKPFLEVKLETTARQQQQQKMAAARQEMPAPQQPGPPRPRPTTLPVVPAFSAARQKELAVPITTPTSGVHFNFDSLMEGGTGLTPVSGPLAPSSCSSQQRSQVPDLSSPDSVNTKLVSL